MKGKKPTRRRVMSKMADVSGPLPCGPGNTDAECGHSKCGPTCNVRYVGPVSSIRDHHSMHAARGAGHIWAATIVTGVALVLTGVMAYTIVDAKTTRDDTQKQISDRAETQRLIQRLNTMEKLLQDVRSFCQRQQPQPPSDTSGSTNTTGTVNP